MKILSVNTKGGFYGGIENTIYRMAHVFQKQGWENIGVFESESNHTEGYYTPFREVWLMDDISLYDLRAKIKDVDVVIIHKITQTRLFDFLLDRYPVILMIHDHDYYCPRKFKYFPFIHTNCTRPFHPVFCTLCSGMLNRHPGKIPVRPISILKNLKMLRRIRDVYRVIILSEFMRKNLILNQIPPDHIVKIYPFLEQKDYPPKKERRTPELLFMGRIIPAKGVDLLVEAMRQVQSPCHLTIVGTGSDLPHIKNLIDKYNLRSRITLAGWVKDPEKYYQKADMVLIPSRWQEPFGLAGVEAFSYGLPVIAFDVGGIHEWLIDHCNGYRVPPNDVSSFASTIDELLRNPGLRRQMGHAGWESIGNIYSEDAFLKRFKMLIEGLHE
ncbi:glycosyltransferase family 4 protein [Fidelibacter multiformis]|jgi:glycosyltransferase involved in cell wall biosynthesis|uniref:glycosyltransferase family 4 protein n=1 Tax=Fidelibacter multiformis TaxID=3377529 RepID=UPI0037DC55F1